MNNDLYCGKRLHFTTPPQDNVFPSTSLHFHANKHETMYVESGQFQISVVHTESGGWTHWNLIDGDSIVIPPNTPHRITALKIPSVLVEFSTHHEDSDSYRIKV